MNKYDRIETPILFLVYKRLDTTQKVFESIKSVKPKKLYIAADGPKNNKESYDTELVRNFILNNIDWDVEVKTLFRENNLGCRKAVSSAITWFFENEEKGIILEDDTLPSISFFYFCDELLEKYKNDLRIWHIGGYKPHFLKGDEYSYNFTRFTHIWGWATWRNRWKCYSENLSNYEDYETILDNYEYFCHSSANRIRKEILDKIVNNELDTWDYQWNYTVRINNGLAIRPSVNLVINLGIGHNDATHTTWKKKYSDVLEEINFPLKHPPFIMVHKKNDDMYIRKNFGSIYFWRIKEFIKKINLK
ncbi:hypothetical protein GFV12_06835 [Desulfurobacterium thermolithotrophum]|uniref:hypothetical protein n=1 Tax=Desulfurobacterium thermolithotrophum TaxID=64160 RepID=UPI0013CFD9C3|nr:hypothetical protein [Desulfurobacterium thermolithotrophum]